MTDTLDRLKSALADHYTIEREIGAGGMAVSCQLSAISYQRSYGDPHLDDFHA